jgi:hypothetical protein
MLLQSLWTMLRSAAVRLLPAVAESSVLLDASRGNLPDLWPTDWLARLRTAVVPATDAKVHATTQHASSGADQRRQRATTTDTGQTLGGLSAGLIARNSAGIRGTSAHGSGHPAMPGTTLQASLRRIVTYRTTSHLAICA